LATPPSESDPARSASFGQIAKRWTNFGANLFATGLVIVMAIVLGRQVLVWWSNPTPVATPLGASAGDTHWASEQNPHRMKFGDSPAALTRDVVHGDAAAAADRLHAYCKTIAAQGKFPEGSAGPAEQRFLVQVASRKPVSTGDRWSVYILPKPVLMTAAVLRDPGEADRSPRERVAAWGIAMPTAADALGEPNQWTLHIFDPAGESSGALPPLHWAGYMRRTVSMESPQGEAMVALAGPGPMEKWQTFFDDELPRHHYQRQGEWINQSNRWQATYQHEQQQLQVLLTEDPSEIRAVVSLEAEPRE